MTFRRKTTRRKWGRRPKVADEDRKRAKPKAPYFCYALVSVDHPTKSYVGFASQCARRRLDEHNSANSKTKTTRKYAPWKLVAIVGGFQEHEHALQFEWRWQYEQCTRKTRKRACKLGNGEAHTLTALERTRALKRWTSKAPLAETVALTVERVL